MKVLKALLKKEWIETVRSGRLVLLIIIFTILGIMNPAIAKLTPWMLDMMAESLEGSGLVVTEISVDAMTSWTQFFKNIPLGLITFILMYSSIFTKEYQSGTLVMVLTKGISRVKVLAAKLGIVLFMWTICYWLNYGVTYAYNEYFWKNSTMEQLTAAVILWWLFGIWTIILLILFSTLSMANTGVLTGTGGCVLVSYLLGLFPRLKDYVPTKLMESFNIVSKIEEIDMYEKAVIVTLITSIICLAVSIQAMNKKKI